MSTRWRRWCGRIGRNNTGNIALSAAVGIPLACVAAGGTIDYLRMFDLKERAQNAADASVVHLARYIVLNRGDSIPPPERDKIASRIFTAQIGTDVSTTFDVTSKREKSKRLTTLAAHTTMPSTFLKIVGIPSLTFTVSSTAEFEQENFAVEVAFVVNTSASMNSTRKTAALTDALNAVMDRFTAVNTVSPNRARVALVPFQIGVTMPMVTSSHYMWTGWPGALPTSNCVTDRVSPYAYQQVAPSGHDLMTLHPVAEATDAPAQCDGSAVVAVTTNLASVRSKLPTPGWITGTNGAIGLLWGWNMLTPGAPFSKSGTIPLESDQTHLERALIYVTDGENTGNAFGMAPSVVDDWVLRICSGLKGAGITVITINVDGDGSESILSACASGPDRYKKVPAPDLPKILEDLAEVVTGYTPIRLVE